MEQWWWTQANIPRNGIRTCKRTLIKFSSIAESLVAKLKNCLKAILRMIGSHANKMPSKVWSLPKRTFRVQHRKGRPG